MKINEVYGRKKNKMYMNIGRKEKHEIKERNTRENKE
jgi:hypothetical protein